MVELCDLCALGVIAPSYMSEPFEVCVGMEGRACGNVRDAWNVGLRSGRL